MNTDASLYVLKENDIVLGAISINNKQHPEYKRMPDCVCGWYDAGV